MTKQEKQKMWVGIGIGAVAGIGGGFLIGSRVTRKKARREMKKLRHQAYMNGLNDGIEESKKYIDELTDSVVLVDSTDPDVIQKAVEAHLKAHDPQMSSNSENNADAPNGAFLGQTEAFCEDNSSSASKNTEKPAQSDKSEHDFMLPDPLNIIGVDYDGDNIIFANGDNPPLTYPKWLFLDNYGRLRDVSDIRNDLKRYEKTIAHLCVIWNRLGWGNYVMDLDGISEDDDINKYDVSIDDTMLGDEPMEQTIERQRYLDEIDRYQAHPEEAPHIISRQDFEEENYLDQRYFDYYEVDNVFVESNDVDNPVDAVTLFGTNNGQELFNWKPIPGPDEGDDPDIVHVKNFKMNSVMEVTRWHKSYKSVRDGSAYIHGSSD